MTFSCRAAGRVKFPPKTHIIGSLVLHKSLVLSDLSPECLLLFYMLLSLFLRNGCYSLPAIPTYSMDDVQQLFNIHLDVGRFIVRHRSCREHQTAISACSCVPCGELIRSNSSNKANNSSIRFPMVHADRAQIFVWCVCGVFFSILVIGAAYIYADYCSQK